LLRLNPGAAPGGHRLAGDPDIPLHKGDYAMSNATFTAMIVEEESKGKFTRRIGQKPIDDLPPGDVLIRVFYSSLNYKDALSAIGNRGVTRNYPHTPGIDAAGIVEKSQTERFKPGQEVLVTGYDLGMNTSGGFGAFIRVPAGWVVSLPHNLSLKESMIYGTAGFTAGLSVDKLVEGGISPDAGPVLVTGATGGVGSLAVCLLAKAGYDVIAASGKTESDRFLMDLGAKQVIHRSEIDDGSQRPLLKARWKAVVDTVGGNILATAIRSTQPHGIITCCGNVASADLALTVYPFILRGVSLMGVDSAETAMDQRLKVWAKLAGEWKPDTLSRLSSEIALPQLDQHIDLILAGKQLGRRLVKHSEIA
jgi:acrylyl-CoA reductase (NADPH)